MTLSQTRHRISRFAVAATSAFAALLAASPVLASQGPGGGLGTATLLQRI